MTEQKNDGGYDMRHALKTIGIEPASSASCKQIRDIVKGMTSTSARRSNYEAAVARNIMSWLAGKNGLLVEHFKA